VRLPSEIKHISASQDRVAVVTTSFEVFIWNVGGSLKALQLHEAEETAKGYNLVQLVVVFHPEITNKPNSPCSVPPRQILQLCHHEIQSTDKI
jgi:hypothetical protein